MGISARFVLAPRGLNGSSTYQAQAAAAESGVSLGFIQQLVFAESKSIRTSTIILASFNILASFTTALSILYDCYWASKRCNPKFKASKFCVSKIHPAETYPLVLSVGIVVQGLVFAAVQGTGLQSLRNESGCGLASQFLWPALFIVPYIQLVFGLECALRSLKRLPLQPRGKYDVTICISAVILMLVGTWVPSFINPEEEGCFASLVWFISRYGQLGFILLSTSAGIMAISALTIFIRLSSASMIEQDQRIAASRMVYYLVLGLVSMAFVIPYFVSQTIGNGNIKTAMMATVVLNLSGLMTGLLQLFLRSNTANTAFGPKSQFTNRNKQEIRIWGPNELAFGHALRHPIEEPQKERAESRRGLTAVSIAESRRSSIGEKGRIISLAPPPSPDFKAPISKYNASSTNAFQYIGTIGSALAAVPNPEDELPRSTVSAVTSPSRARKQSTSYSIFPSDILSPTKSSMKPADSVYDISELVPPPVIHFPGGSRHRRDSSMNTIASSATVQIGLRLSHAPMPSQDDVLDMPLPATTYSAPGTKASPATLQIQTSNLSSTTYKPSLLRPVPNPSTRVPESLQPEAPSPERDVRMKTLPPTPRIVTPENKRLSKSHTMLSPTVYSPEASKKTLPFKNNSATTQHQRSASETTHSDHDLRSPPPPARSNSGRTIKKEDVKDWI